MPSFQIALAGATGNLGTPILEALIGAGYQVTALSRIGGSSSKLKPHPNLVIKEVDFNSVDSLTAALHGTQVVVSCLATLAIGSQNPLIDASVAANVKRFIPAEFGMDSKNVWCMRLPVCEPKVATQRYLLQKSESNPGFTYTGIANGLFLDWCIEADIILNLDRHTATLYNGGDIPFTATTRRDVSKAVLGVISHPKETANRIVYVQSALVTQNRLIQYAKEIDRKSWDITVKSTEDVRQESFHELAKGSDCYVDAAMLGFCIVASWTSQYGCDFSSHLDNELLGINEMGEADLRDFIGSYL